MLDNKTTATEIGWLDEDGICEFPEDIVAIPLGFKAPGIPRLDKLSPEKLQEAVDRGYIRFIDGNGAAHSFQEYVMLFPGYPDPIWILEQQGKWPPKPAFQI